MTTKATVTLVVRVLAVAAIAGVAIAAFRLSFVALRELAVAANIPAGDAWLFPVIIDVTTATAAATALLVDDSGVRRWFVGVLVVGTGVSIAGNAVHSLMVGPSPLGWGAAVVASLPPVALLVQTHALLLLFRLSAAPAPLPVASESTVPEPISDSISDSEADEPVPVPVEAPAPAAPTPPADPVPVRPPRPAVAAAAPVARAVPLIASAPLPVR
ncbi:DUF2637 domain-containing protein [Nocardia otitidiscaviarum]|uniref:DUF2637 domain-containing protein n=1 Tax=Nocardia otitidiscaviarum TaxID=1823 RepID=A0A516NIY6_9NOCA|nr:DUF2637 domain-containing protein [Nocardia otitidiscaviarum]MCP9619683.1 DUF2637 domain-containing protein [Nocardia otitidiscaviarum]QDP78874.1 DUF2637 domain-containing protein [Nocardia otitidiscaviarum]